LTSGSYRQPQESNRRSLGSPAESGLDNPASESLETQLDSLGLEKAQGFETGIEDPDSLAATERLIDYPDYHAHDEDDLGPEYEKNVARYILESEDPTQ
jgi:hypothetical protein